MRVLVFAHRLEVGGTQVNAIELSTALRDLCGHDVVLFATPGPMLALAQKKGLRYIAAPDARRHPSTSRALALRRVVRAERPDVLHVWDWPQCLDALYGTHLMQGLPMVVTDMSMVLSRLLPKSVTTTFGTPELVAKARSQGRRSVELLLPPVDVQFNAPGQADGKALRERLRIASSETVLVTVTRLTEWMKAESLRRTAEVVGRLARRAALRFVVVGDGSARPAFERMARKINAELGRPVVLLTGAMLDPRQAYAAADLVVGMGGSVLRGMAFAKPALVVGERGFAAAFNRETRADFLYRGLYGVGGDDPGNLALEACLRELLDGAAAWPALGEWSRRFVIEHFALDSSAWQLSELLRASAERGTDVFSVAGDAVRTAGLLAGRRLLPYAMRRRMLAARPTA